MGIMPPLRGNFDTVGQPQTGAGQLRTACGRGAEFFACWAALSALFHWGRRARVAGRAATAGTRVASAPGMLRTGLTAPFIYSVALPLAALDLWISLYQRICFPLYGLPLVRRRDFVVIDRHRLPYLNALEKANCAYCGYANGVIAYAREVIGRTEAYWCPIKHARPIRVPHGRYQQFLDYGDAAGYRRRLAAYRRRHDSARQPRLASDAHRHDITSRG